jgi:hypothetical protein
MKVPSGGRAVTEASATGAAIIGLKTKKIESIANKSIFLFLIAASYIRHIETETPFLRRKLSTFVEFGFCKTPVYTIPPLHSQAGTGFLFVITSPLTLVIAS